MASCRLAAAEVRLCLLDGGALLGTHLEILGALDLVVAAVAHLEPGVAHVVSAAAKPFAAHVLDPIALQAPVHVVVSKGRTVVTHRGFREDNFVRLTLAGLNDGELLSYALFHVTLRETDFEKTSVLGVEVAIGINLRMNVRALREKRAIHYQAP